jgi:TfoX/Sxy family transcriptional regulator of competence genes
MKWKKVTPELNAFLEKNMAPFKADRRPMFGASTYFVNGNMFAGIHEDTVILRLAEKDRREIMATNDEVKLFEPITGRPMREYVALPESVYNEPDVFQPWLKRSYEYALSLKPKEKATGRTAPKK